MAPILFRAALRTVSRGRMDSNPALVAGIHADPSGANRRGGPGALGKGVIVRTSQLLEKG